MLLMRYYDKKKGVLMYMFLGLKNISKDATSAVKSSVQKKTSAKKKLSTTAAAVAEGKQETVQGKSMRPGTATLDKPLLLQDNCKRTDSGAEARPPTTKRPVAQQFNTRTYRIKTKDRKSVLSLPEVSKQAVKNRKSYLPIKVKAPAPAPPIRKRNENTSLPSNDQENVKSNVTTTEVDKYKTPEEYQPEKWVPTAVASARKKRLVVCYLCGKEFGTASMPFHEPQCIKVGQKIFQNIIFLEFFFNLRSQCRYFQVVYFILKTKFLDSY